MLFASIKKSISIALLSTLSGLGVASVARANNYAYPDYFTCRQVDGVYTTFAVKGDRNFQIIRWVSGFGAAAGYTPEQRCQEVSNRFDHAVRNQSLRYLTHGTMNNYPVICTASYRGGNCENLIFTLPAAQAHRAADTLRELGDVARGASGAMYQSGASIVSEGDNGNVYVDFDLYLDVMMNN